MPKAALKERTATLLDEIDPPAKPKAEVAKVATPKIKKTGTAVAVHKPAPPLAPKSLLEVIKDAAADPRVDVAKMEALLRMAREEEARAAEHEFNAAMLLAQTEMPKVPRDSFNKHTKSWWARIEQVAAKCDPTIRKHGFTISYGMGESPLAEHYRIIADVSHKGGCTKRFYADFGNDAVGAKGGGTKSPAQGSASTITYGRRNLKLMIFDVLVLGMDQDGNPGGVEPISAEAFKDLRKLLKDANITEEQFCEVYKIEKVEQLPATKLQNALDRIAQKQKATS